MALGLGKEDVAIGFVSAQLNFGARARCTHLKWPSALQLTLTTTSSTDTVSTQISTTPTSVPQH
jgi:hypothetical protein